MSKLDASNTVYNVTKDALDAYQAIKDKFPYL